MQWFNLIQGLLAIALVVVSGFFGVQQGRVKQLRETVDDLRGRMTDLLSERTDDKSKITDLEAAVKVLTGTVTGEAYLVALTHQLDDHHKESMTVLTSIQQSLEAP